MSAGSASTWMDGLKTDDRVGVHTGKTNFVVGRVVRLTSTLVVVEIPGWATLQRFRREDGLRVGEDAAFGAKWTHHTRIVQLTEHVQQLAARSRLLIEVNRLTDGHRRDRFAQVSDAALQQVAELLKGGGV